MLPAAVLQVVVTAEGVGPTNAQLASVQAAAKKTAATVDAAGSSLATTGAKLERAGTTIGKVGKAATKYYATPLLAAAAASTYFGMKYEKSMLLVQTHTDTNKKNLALYKRSLLEMSASGKYTQGPSELAEGLYHVASDGFKGAKALDIVSKSAKLAMVGQSGMAETTYAVVSAMKNQIAGAKTAGETINNLNAIMGAGDTKMAEVTGSMSTGIIPAAKQMGLSFEDVGAALDLLTQRGVPAQQGAYRLAMTFQQLIPHTEKAEEAFERLGLGQMSLVNAIEKNPKHGLLSAMELLEEHLKKIDGSKGTRQIKDIEEIFGGGRTSRGAISMLQNLPGLADTYGRIHKLARETPHKIEIAEEAPVNQLKEALVQLEAVLTKIGEQIIPALVIAMHTLVGILLVAFHIFNSLPHGVQAAIMVFLALTVALAYLIRIIGWVVKSFGGMLKTMGDNIAETEAQVSVNEQLAASYQMMAEAAVESAAAQSAAIAEVTAALEAQSVAEDTVVASNIAGQTSMLIPEAAGAGGQLSLLATNAGEVGAGVASGAAAVEASGAAAGAAAGDAAATGFAASFSGGIGAALAAAPEIVIPAAVIAGIGFGGYELGKSIFGGSHTTSHAEYLRNRVAQTSETAGISHERATKASSALIQSEHRLKAAKNSSRAVDHRVKAAQDQLTHAQRKYGDSSHAAAKALHHLDAVKTESVAIDRKAANAQKLYGVVRTATMRADKTEIASIREKKNAIKDEIGQLRNRLRVITHEPASEERGQKEAAKLRQIHDAIKKVEEAKAEENLVTKEAATQIGPKFAHYLEKIEPKLYGLKHAAHAAGIGINEYSEKIQRMFVHSPFATMDGVVKRYEHIKNKAGETGKEVDGPFKTQFHNGMTHAAQSVENFEKSGVESMQNFQSVFNETLSSMGGSPLNFSGAKGPSKKHKEVAHKARGGHINVGAAVGDSVPAMLEKGEYVINREAVAKMGVHKLNEINFGLAPRFMQVGGSVSTGSANMSVGNEPQILSDLYKLSSELHKVVYVISGYRTPQHSVEVGGFADDPHTKGEAADIGVGSALRDSMFGVKEAMLKNVGLYRPFYPPDPNEVNHVQLFGKQMAGAMGAAMKNLPKMQMSGPEGGLLKVGNSALNILHNQGQHYLKKYAEAHGGAGGSVKLLAGKSGNVLKEMDEALKAGGANRVGAAGAMGNAYRESLWNPAAVGTGGGGLFGFTSGAISLASLQAAASRAGVPWANAKFQTEFMLRHGGESLMPAMNKAGSPEAAARLFMEQWERPGIPALGEREHAARRAYNMGYQKGGIAGVDPAKQLTHPGRTKLGKILAGIGGKHPGKAKGNLRKYMRKIEGVGIKGPLMDKLDEVTSNVEKYDENASNAGELTHTIEEGPLEGTVVQGMFKNRTEGEWDSEKLNELLHVRKMLIKAHDLVAKKQVHVRKILKEAKTRLIAIRKVIKQAENQKKAFESKIKDLEKSQNDNVQKLEKEKTGFEHELTKAQNAKKPDKSVVSKLRGEIKERTQEIADGGKSGREKIKALHEKVLSKEGFVKNRTLIEEALKGAVPTIEGKYGELGDTKSALYEGGGTTGHDNFTGLQTVQGRGGTTGKMPEPPPLGSVGGEIFNVTKRMADIQQEMERKPRSDSGSNNTTGEEIKNLKKEIDIDWEKRYLVGQYQSSVLRGFPTVQATAAIPYAGAFALGGSVLARVGERGPEDVVVPNGSRVVSQAEARSAVSADRGGSTTLIIDELNVYEDGSVEAKIGDQTLDVKVKKSNKKQGRRSQAITPGGL